VSLLAKRYATAALISASLRGWSAGALLFELYQIFGIQVTFLIGDRIAHPVLHPVLRQLAVIFVRIGPGFRKFSKPFVL
jgi:hypothetical protein